MGTIGIEFKEWPPCYTLPDGATEPCPVGLQADEHRSATNIADNLIFFKERCAVALHVLKAQGFHEELYNKVPEGCEFVCPLRLFADLVPSLPSRSETDQV